MTVGQGVKQITPLLDIIRNVKCKVIAKGGKQMLHLTFDCTQGKTFFVLDGRRRNKNGARWIKTFLCTHIRYQNSVWQDQVEIWWTPRDRKSSAKSKDISHKVRPTMSAQMTLSPGPFESRNSSNVHCSVPSLPFPNVGPTANLPSDYERNLGTMEHSVNGLTRFAAL